MVAVLWYAVTKPLGPRSDDPAATKENPRSSDLEFTRVGRREGWPPSFSGVTDRSVCRTMVNHMSMVARENHNTSSGGCFGEQCIEWGNRITRPSDTKLLTSG
jgi:hypothetical protein